MKLLRALHCAMPLWLSSIIETLPKWLDRLRRETNLDNKKE